MMKIITIVLTILGLVADYMRSTKSKAKSSYLNLRSGYEMRRQKRIDRVTMHNDIDKLLNDESKKPDAS